MKATGRTYLPLYAVLQSLKLIEGPTSGSLVRGLLLTYAVKFRMQRIPPVVLNRLGSQCYFLSGGGL